MSMSVPELDDPFRTKDIGISFMMILNDGDEFQTLGSASMGNMEVDHFQERLDHICGVASAHIK